MAQTALEFAENNYYGLESYDESGYIGIDTKEFARLLYEYASQVTGEALEEGARKAKHKHKAYDSDFIIDKKSITEAYNIEKLKP